MSDLLYELRWRNLLYDVTPGLEERLKSGPITAYGGFDPTASSLQIGNLVLVMLLAHLQRTGGTPILLVGGGTGMIGDPSGKRSERPLLDPEQIEQNVARQRRQLERFLDFTGSNAARMVNNAEWLSPLKLVEFLRNVGKHFTLSYMLQKESVKSRLEEGISFTEFAYMLLQAYDFLHLFRTHQCEAQLGGSDQWGNMTAGVELIRRAEGAEAHAACAPLITTSTGVKFGKTEEGSLWLDPTMTSPYRFYQFWINLDDDNVESYLKIFTFESEKEIGGEIMRIQRKLPALRHAQHHLAMDLTSRVHGAETALRVANASKVMFGQTQVLEAKGETWELLFDELSGCELNRSELPTSIVDLAAASGLVKSKSEARRQLQQGGISLNGYRVDPDSIVDANSLLAGRYLWLRRGKKTDVIVRTRD